MHIELSIDIAQEVSEYCNTGVHTFFRHLRDMSKFKAPDDIKRVPNTENSPISVATAQNLFARQSWRPRAVYPYTKTIINRARILIAVDVSWVTSSKCMPTTESSNRP
jgi:hypothetical protein